MGRNATDVVWCGEVYDAACDGGCVKGAVERWFADGNGTAAAAFETNGACGRVGEAADACARAVGWTMTSMNATRDAWDACGVAGRAAGVAACRYGVAEALVKSELTRAEASAANAGKACVGMFSLESGRSASDGARATEACARALGAALATRHEYDESKAREECDSIANTRVKRVCARAASEEVIRRDVSDDVEVPFCTSALKTTVGSATPSVHPPPPPPPPSGPMNRDQVEHRKEAIRRHGTSVGGALWWACFLSLVVLIACVSVYVYWRDGGSLGSLSPQPRVQYSRVGVAATELGVL